VGGRAPGLPIGVAAPTK